MFRYMVSLFHCCEPVVRENTMLVRVPVRACQEAERERERGKVPSVPFKDIPQRHLAWPPPAKFSSPIMASMAVVDPGLGICPLHTVLGSIP